MKNFNKQEVEFIQQRSCERITEIFDAIGCDYVEQRDYLHSACPVHGGDNQRAMFFAIRSRHWQCKTRGCHMDPITGPSTSVFGLVRGAMSCKTKKEWGFMQAVNFISQVLGLEECSIDKGTAQDMEIAKIVRQHRKKQVIQGCGTPLSTMIPHLSSDQVYYPNRGVPPEIIAKYHVSFCNTKGKPMYKRAFFPILDVTGRYILGWSGRSIYDECGECGMHHHPQRSECPDPKYRGVYTKWRHSKDFHGELCLYNIWHAKYFISKLATAIICEGPGDIWALEAAGVHNGVALLGTSLSRQQRLLLQNAGTLTVVLALDNDDAGKKAMEKLQKDLIHYFRVFHVTLGDTNDIGEMLPDDIAKQIGPASEKMSNRNIVSDCLEKN